jgi:hypothetical protein
MGGPALIVCYESVLAKGTVGENFILCDLGAHVVMENAVRERKHGQVENKDRILAD